MTRPYTPRQQQPLHERFWQKVLRTSDNACWTWTGSVLSAKHHYGTFRVNGRNVLAHRFMKEIFAGPIPEGMVIDHLCRNTICVNPYHLDIVTIGENTRRGDHRFRRMTQCHRGHEFTAENTRMEPLANGSVARRCRECERIRKAKKREYKEGVGK